MTVVDEPGLATKAGRVHKGGNSGYQAINLAWQMGAERIVLLGYDFQDTDGRTHWHGDHEGGLPNLGHLHLWRQWIVSLAIDLRKLGVEVVNASRETAIWCFDRKPLLMALRTSKPVLYLAGMMGLGDNVYQRAVLQALDFERCTVYLETAWPQLYADLPVRCVKPTTGLRTQAKNVAQWQGWHKPPVDESPTRWTYAGHDGVSIVQALCNVLRINPDRLTFDLPQPPKRKRAEPYVLVRPATLRAEWRADSRNPRPEYIAQAARMAREAGYRVVSVADLADRSEWALDPLPPADVRYHAGELDVVELMELVANAAGVIGGVGWLVPMAVAYQTPMLLIFGGWGFHNGPRRLFDARMPAAGIRSVVPDHFCMCGTRDHDCDKRIADFAGYAERWLMELSARRSAAVAA